MKFGILCNFYGFPHYLDKVLEYWIPYKNEFVFAASSCKFDQYIKINYLEEDNSTIELLNTKYKDLISFVYSAKEANDSFVRNEPLKYLLSQNVDYIWLLDGDEFYSSQDIENIKNFVKSNEFISYFKINFKNYFNDEQHWVDGFCPPRIFKVNTKNLKLDSFYFENDLYYADESKNLTDYKNLSHLEIPKNKAHIKHYSWCGSKDFLKNKIKYQNLRYNGICSYAWDESNDCLKLNEDFYQKYNISKPLIYSDN
jgi:hypothetical protein